MLRLATCTELARAEKRQHQRLLALLHILDGKRVTLVSPDAVSAEREVKAIRALAEKMGVAELLTKE